MNSTDPAGGPGGEAPRDPGEARDERAGQGGGSAAGAPPPIEGVHEAALYTNDLAEAAAFYARLGLTEVGRVPGRHVFFRAGRDLLLVFDPRATERGGAVPAHGARGAGHVALDVRDHATLEAWRARLDVLGVEIESEIEWPTGGRSFYFRDPAGNSIELITRGSWGF